ncbi:hypothetical protein D3C78_424690 [compost metagenome]
MGIPDVEIPHLRADGCGHPKHMACRHMPSPPTANGHLELLDQGAPLGRIAYPLVKGRIDLQRRAFADLISGGIVFVHGDSP